MILELSGIGPDVIHVTAQFSNAVLVALLPYFSDVAQKLELPVPHPITMQHVVEGHVMPYRYPNGDILGAGIEVRPGPNRRCWYLGYMRGKLSQVLLLPSYFTIQDPADLKWCYGTNRMTEAEAIQMARDTIKKLGIPLEDVFAEQEPRVTPPGTVHVTNTLPYYRVEWLNPRGGGSSTVDIGVNADKKRVEKIHFGVGDDNIRRPPPLKIDVPTSVADVRPSANPEYAWKLIPIVLRAVEDYSKTLGLPIPHQLTTNHVARFELSDNGGWPHSVVELTNGWQFVYRNSMVNGYYAPDNLFWFLRKNQRTLIKDYVGKLNMSEAQAQKLIRETLAKLNYPTNLVHIDFPPKIRKSAITSIPRYIIVWEYSSTGHGIESTVEAEVDADKGVLKSLFFDNQALWGQPPPIDVPIALPPKKTAKGKTDASERLKPPPRPKAPFKLPDQLRD